MRKKPVDTGAAERVDREELANLNQDLCCQGGHGRLHPDNALWQKVPRSVWDFFVAEREKAATVLRKTVKFHPELKDVAGVLEKHPTPPCFPIVPFGCSQCNASHQASVQTKHDIKSRADTERKIPDLTMVFNMQATTPDTMFAHFIGMKQNPLYVVSTVWLDKWRLYVAPGKPKVGEVRLDPGPVDNTPLLCPCSGQKMNCDPFVEYKKANMYHDKFTLLTGPQWNEFHKKYGGGPVLKWWHETNFLQTFKPTEDVQLCGRAGKATWTDEEDKCLVGLEDKYGAGEWARKFAAFKGEFPGTKKTKGQINDRWRKNNVRKEQAKNPVDEQEHRKRKADEAQLGETQPGTPVAGAVVDLVDDASEPVDLAADDGVAGAGDPPPVDVDGAAAEDVLAQVCEECNRARLVKEEKHQLNYNCKPVYVKHVAKITEMSSGGDAAGAQQAAAGGGVRKSRRERAVRLAAQRPRSLSYSHSLLLTNCSVGIQGKAFQTYTLTASSNDNINTLKMKILEQATGEVFPNQMQIYHNGLKLGDESLALSEHKVKQGACPRLSRAKIYHSSLSYATVSLRVDITGTTLLMVLNEEIIGDYGDAFGGADGDDEETGFTGTALY